MYGLDNRCMECGMCYVYSGGCGDFNVVVCDVCMVEVVADLGVVGR